MNRCANYCECGDHAFTPVTRGYVALVSPEDAYLFDAYTWHTQMCTPRYPVPVRKISGGKTFLLGAEVLGVTPPFQVDHINHDATDNRRGNLRPADKYQNSWNRRSPKHSRQPAKGVEISGASYRARITVFGKRIHLGTYPTVALAASAYDEAARQYFGEFACVNQPEKAS